MISHCPRAALLIAPVSANAMLVDYLCLQSAAIITHSKMVDTAVKAASLSGIPLRRVYTIGRADAAASLTSIEYAPHVWSPG
jgi:hypothetical protein